MLFLIRWAAFEAAGGDMAAVTWFCWYVEAETQAE